MGRQEATVGMLCVPHSSAHSRWTRWEWEWRLLSFTGTADLRVHGWPGMKFQDFPWDLGSWLAAAQDPGWIHCRGGCREQGSRMLLAWGCIFQLQFQAAISLKTLISAVQTRWLKLCDFEGEKKDILSNVLVNR